MSARTSTRRPARAGSFAAAVAAASVVFVAALAGAAPAHAEDAPSPEVTWGVRAASNDFGDARDNYAYRVDAGSTLDDAIVIANYDTTPLELDVYAADGFTTGSGQLDVQTRDASQVSIGKWASPAVNRVTIPVGEAVEVPFTLIVPPNAEPGDYAGALVTSLAQPKVENGLSVDRRLGIRIHLRVRGELAPALSVDGLKVDYSGTLNPFGTGEAVVTYSVRNSGNVRLSAGQQVRLTGPFGLLPVDAAGVDPVPELLPGEVWKVTLPVAGVFPAFALGATVTLDPQAPDDSDDTMPAPADVSETAWTPAVPWTLLVLVVLVAAAITLWIILGRRRRAARAAAEDARVQAAVEEALRGRPAATETVSVSDESVSVSDKSVSVSDASEPVSAARD